MRMRGQFFLFALALTVLGPETAAAQSGLTFPPETLRTWSLTQSEGTLAGRPAIIGEFVPHGQTAERWTEMITIAVIDTRRGRPRPTGLSVYEAMTTGPAD